MILEMLTLALIAATSGRALAGGEQPKPAAKSAQERAALERDLRQLKDEVERLQMENARLKEMATQLQQFKMLREEALQLRKKLQEQIAGESRLLPVKQVIEVYSVAGLTTPAGTDGREAQSLMRVLVNTIEPKSWKELGGEGTIEYYPEGTCLVVRQTADVQRQVQELLKTLRKVKSNSK
jgi:hypothetical protein